MNYSALTTMYETDIRILTVVTSHEASKVTYHEKKISFYQNSIACHNDANGIKPGITQK